MDQVREVIKAVGYEYPETAGAAQITSSLRKSSYYNISATPLENVPHQFDFRRSEFAPFKLQEQLNNECRRRRMVIRFVDISVGRLIINAKVVYKLQLSYV